MPTLSRTPTLKTHARTHARLGGGGRPPVIEFPRFGGGGDGGRDDRFPGFGEQLRRYRLGLMVGLAAVTMLFVTFTATYMFRHSLGTWDAASSSYVNDWQPLHLPLRLLLLNTAVLLLSSVTMEQARKAAFRAAVVAPIMAMPGIARERGRAPWIPITPALGLCFLGGQYLAWREMARRGFFLATGPSSSFFYVLTALHAVHLLGGIIALSYAVAVTFRPGSLERRRIAVDVTAWYWHFMAVLWVYILVLLVLTT